MSKRTTDRPGDGPHIKDNTVISLFFSDYIARVEDYKGLNFSIALQHCSIA